MSFTDHDVAEVRHVVQRILVPCVFVIGLLGNSVSIYILTRRRMRCTTNIYLTALAITDIIYLTMALLLSLQHYHYVHLYCKIYWMCYGVVVWLCDACSYISIYIAVCFTIERFIAIRYPLKRQTFCTETLAKKVIAGVTLFCLLSTISTAFEHQHRIEYRLMDNHGRPCNQTVAKTYAMHQHKQQHQQQQYLPHPQDSQQRQQPEIPLKLTEKFVEYLDEIVEGSGQRNERDFILSNDMNVLHGVTTEGKLFQESQRGIGLRSDQKKALTVRAATNIPLHLWPTSSSSSSSLPARVQAAHPPVQSENLLRPATEFVMQNRKTDRPTNSPELLSLMASEATAVLSSPHSDDDDTNILGNYSAIEMLNELFLNVTDFCENVTYYNHQPTALGNDDFYINVWYFVTLCVFVMIPLCVLVTFNCFLIMLVRRSHTIRGEMTNANSIRRTKRRTISSSVSQENRVTITLIAVVLLFIVCQLPWAVYLIVSCQIEIESHLQSIFGNIFNFLAATNAAANFFLYCVLSDKYRKTIREMITGYRYKQQRNTLTTSTTNGGSRRSYRPASTSLVIK